MSLTKEQIELRKTGISASQIPIVIYGEHFGRTKLDLYDEIINGKSFEQTINMKEGLLLEPLCAELFEEETGFKTYPHQKTIFKDFPEIRLLATPDFTVNEKGKIHLLETKVSARHNEDEWGDSFTDHMPKKYLLQIAQQCLVSDVNKAFLCVYFKFKQKIRIYEYERNKEVENYIIEHAKRFWVDHILPKVPPSPLGYEETKEMFTTVDPLKSVIADNDDLMVVEKIKELRQQKKLIDEQEEYLKTKIAGRMENAKIMIDVSGQKIAEMYEVKRETFDKKSFNKKHPNLLDEFLTVKTTKSMRIL